MPVSLPVIQAFRSIERKESGIDAARCLMTGRPDKRTWQSQSLTANRRVDIFSLVIRDGMAPPKALYGRPKSHRENEIEKAKKAFSIFIFPLTRSSHSNNSPPKVQEFSRGETNEQSQT